MIPIAIGMLPETMTQCRRIITDGGTIISQRWMDRVIRTLKAQGIYSSCKFLADANFAVKKDGSNAVSTLYDISGNNNDATQATGANQPIWTEAQQNGKAGLVFDGTNDYLLTTFGSPIAQPDTVIVAGSATHVVVNPAHFFYDGAAATDQCTFYETNSDDLSFWAGTVLLSGVTTKGFMVLTSIFDGANSGLFKNTASIKTGNSGAQGLTGLTIGIRQALDNPFKGPISTLIAFDVALSTAQRQAMETLINQYYAIY